MLTCCATFRYMSYSVLVCSWSALSLDDVVLCCSAASSPVFTACWLLVIPKFRCIRLNHCSVCPHVWRCTVIQSLIILCVLCHHVFVDRASSLFQKANLLCFFSIFFIWGFLLWYPCNLYRKQLDSVCEMVFFLSLSLSLSLPPLSLSRHLIQVPKTKEGFLHKKGG